MSFGDPCLERLARRAVAALGVTDGQLVEVRSDIAWAAWVEALALAVEHAGGVPFLNVTSLKHQAERIVALPIERLRQPSSLLVELAERADAIIVIERDWSPLASLCPPERLTAWYQSLAVIIEKQESRRVPYCLIAHPDTVAETSLWVPKAEHHALYQAAMEADAEAIRQRAERLIARLSSHSQLEIVTGAGDCRLLFRFDGRVVRANDGRLTAGYLSFPFGSVYVAPLEDTVAGAIRFERWRQVEGLTLKFHGGRLCAVSADCNLEQFTRLLDAHSGDKDRVSHVGIGINTEAEALTGHVALDECLAGALFLALGENRYLGGCNQSTLNLDLVCSHATVLHRGEVLVDNGRLVIQSR
jgi:leucyl aminopeptidase (aminopeptidase T)